MTSSETRSPDAYASSIIAASRRPRGVSGGAAISRATASSPSTPGRRLRDARRIDQRGRIGLEPALADQVPEQAADRDQRARAAARGEPGARELRSGSR